MGLAGRIGAIYQCISQKHKFSSLRFEVLTTVNIEISVFWDIIAFSLGTTVSEERRNTSIFRVIKLLRKDLVEQSFRQVSFYGSIAHIRSSFCLGTL